MLFSNFIPLEIVARRSLSYIFDCKYFSKFINTPRGFLAGFILKTYAQSGGGTPVKSGIKIINPLCADNSCTIMGILQNIALYMMLVGAPIATIMILYAGFQIMSAGGDPEKFKTGTKTLLYTTVGYGVILLSWGAISLVKDLLGA